MRHSPSTVRSPIVNRKGNPPSFAGPLTVSEPHRMMATAKATSSPAVMASFFDVERLRGLVVPEEQVPRFLVLIHASRLYRRRDVEHHDVLIVMGKNGGKIVPADGRRPGFDKCFDVALRR